MNGRSSKEAHVYRPRLVDAVVQETLLGLPAVLLVGPRASGKTTSARRHARSIVRLDREAEAAPFRADPDAVLSTLDTPALIDEWQIVPEVLGAVKRAVDARPVAGQFLLTGSVRAELLEAMWAATGRVVRLTQWGMSERELSGHVHQRSFFDRVFSDGLGAVDGWFVRPGAPNLRDYVALSLRGTFPELALQPSESIRRRWLSAYVDQLMFRDAGLAHESRDPQKLRRYLRALAANTAGVVEHKTLYQAAGITRPTATAYDSLLELLFVAEQVPAWHTNRLKRLIRTPKRFLTEPAMMGTLLGVDVRGVIRNGDLLGRLLETFVLGQLRSEASAANDAVMLHHVRAQNSRHEIDLLAEHASGRVLAIEVKATASPSADDAKHLLWLKSCLAADMIGGIVFHTGPRAMQLAPDVLALPIASLWAPAAGKVDLSKQSQARGGATVHRESLDS